MPVHLVTGATDGIGKQTARQLGRRGAHVVVHGRSEAKAAEAVSELQREGGSYEPAWADLASLSQTRALAERVLQRHPVLDGLLCNAGVFMKERVLTEDGLETTMAVNHFSHFVLVHALLPALQAAGQGRVVHVSSVAHQRGTVDLGDLTFARAFDGYTAYASSKLANVLFSNELSRRLRGTAVTSNALHPGVIGTKLLARGFGAGGAALPTGAVTSVYCATAPELATVSGEYFSDGRTARMAGLSRDEPLARAFYLRSCELTGVAPR